VLLLLGLALTLNITLVSAAESPNISTQSLQSSQYTTNTSHVSTTSTTLKTVGNATGSPSQNIKVLIYSGTGSIASCVNGIKTVLNTANNNNLVPGYTFTYSTSSSITSSILANYDLLAMPGGSSGKIYLNYVSQSAVRNFVSSGHGYLGICAGAYSGSSAVYSGSTFYYNGWGVAPHVKSKAYNHEGNLLVSMTDSASSLLGASGTTTIVHYNGPAIYGSGFTTFANYASGSYSGYAAIVGDTYGSGRSVLSGPHPELEPQNSILLSKLIVWAANVQSVPTNAVTLSQINKAARDVKAYVETNHKMPVYITVGGQLFNQAQFLHLLTSDLIRINSGSTSAVTIKSVSIPGAATDTVKTGNILKTEYLAIANRVLSYINTNSKAPTYAVSSRGNIRFGSLIYMYSKIMAYYYTNGRLPGYVSMAHWTYPNG
jgi:glutamine amidotransferase-like uncharacterized protein